KSRFDAAAPGRMCYGRNPSLAALRPALRVGRLSLGSCDERRPCGPDLAGCRRLISTTVPVFSLYLTGALPWTAPLPLDARCAARKSGCRPVATQPTLFFIVNNNEYNVTAPKNETRNGRLVAYATARRADHTSIAVAS